MNTDNLLFVMIPVMSGFCWHLEVQEMQVLKSDVALALTSSAVSV